jgi:hypothetical protein
VQLFTAARLDRMREAGVTRGSRGIQQLNPGLAPSEAERLTRAGCCQKRGFQ